MKLENILVKALGDDSEKVVRAVQALPEGTVKGMSEFGFFKALILRDGTIKMGNFDYTSTDSISVNVPEDAENVRYNKRKMDQKVSFRYAGNNYEIYYRYPRKDL
jgi:hypothetical protein